MKSGDFTKLQPRQRKYLEGLARGMSRREALRAAQYSENTAPSRVENASVKAAFARIVRRAVPAHKIAQRIAEGVDATATVFFQKDGAVVESRDVIAWGERRKYIQLAVEYGGYVASGRSSEDMLTPPRLRQLHQRNRNTEKQPRLAPPENFSACVMLHYGNKKNNRRGVLSVYHFVYHCNRELPSANVCIVSDQKQNPLS